MIESSPGFSCCILSQCHNLSLYKWAVCPEELARIGLENKTKIELTLNKFILCELRHRYTGYNLCPASIHVRLSPSGVWWRILCKKWLDSSLRNGDHVLDVSKGPTSCRYGHQDNHCTRSIADELQYRVQSNTEYISHGRTNVQEVECLGHHHAHLWCSTCWINT